MPEAGIRSLLGPSLPDPTAAHGIPRAEVYLMADDPVACHARALAAGATELSALARRSWGDDVACSIDPDGHVVTFATRPADAPSRREPHYLEPSATPPLLGVTRGEFALPIPATTAARRNPFRRAERGAS